MALRFAWKFKVAHYLILALLLSGSVSAGVRVVVNKSKGELLILNDNRVIRSYKVAVGRSPLGPKTGQTVRGLSAQTIG